MRNFVNSLIGIMGAGTFYAISVGMFAGWAYWMWSAIQLGSFAMFLFGLFGPFGFVAAALGLWSLFFGLPKWLLVLLT